MKYREEGRKKKEEKEVEELKLDEEGEAERERPKDEEEEEEDEEEEKAKEKESEETAKASDEAQSERPIPSFFLKKSLSQTVKEREMGKMSPKPGSESGPSHPIAIPKRFTCQDEEEGEEGEGEGDASFTVHRSTSYRSISRRCGDI